MYSDKPTVNILTSLMVDKGIRRVIVCPGSRNIPLIHNFSECPYIDCYPVTDERSAGFYAIGMSLATAEPVAICVTSGSAILNTAPAIAEAYYRCLPIVVISADRPIERIDRLDGQTLRQNNILSNIVKQQTDIPDFTSDDNIGLDFSSLSMNIALNECIGGECGPVHINMQLKEPLFNFSTNSLPTNKNITSLKYEGNEVNAQCEFLIERFLLSKNRIIVIGQISEHEKELDEVIKCLKKYFLVLCEPLSTSYADPFDKAIPPMADELKMEKIDMVISLGGNFVSKKIKEMLRNTDICEHWEINKSGRPHDIFEHQTGIAMSSEIKFLSALLKRTRNNHIHPDNLKKLLTPYISKALNMIEGFTPSYSQYMAVRELELSLEDVDYDFVMHYANSMAVRLGCLCFSKRYIYCNRGINGIEGNISTAAGFSLATNTMVFCVTGDLSFFYDQNALWNSRLNGNLRIMLLNNGGGSIFYRLNGLDTSDMSMSYISGKHHTDARGICEQNDIGYLAAHNTEEYHNALVRFLTEQTKRPMVMEVFTDYKSDNLVLDQLDEQFNKNLKTMNHE